MSPSSTCKKAALYFPAFRCEYPSFNASLFCSCPYSYSPGRRKQDKSGTALRRRHAHAMEGRAKFAIFFRHTHVDAEQDRLPLIIYTGIYFIELIIQPRWCLSRPIHDRRCAGVIRNSLQKQHPATFLKEYT